VSELCKPSPLVCYAYSGWAFQMLRRSLCTIGLPVALVALSSAHAADTTLTLACQGTTTFGTEAAKPEPVSMGIIVNFTTHTVHGFGYPGSSGRFDFPVKITGMNEATVAFHSSSQTGESITGSIDRVTGDVEARIQMSDSKTDDLLSILRYALKCRPTQRMF
jgi:hypothetical protein